MAVIQVLSRLIDGVVRNVNLSKNTLHVDALRVGTDSEYVDITKSGYEAVAADASAGAAHADITSGNPHAVSKSDVGLSNVTNDAQVKGLASGTTSGNLVAFGADGYTVADSGSKPADFEPANSNIQSHISSTENPHSVTKSQVGLGNVTNDAQLPLAGGTMSGFITLHADPTSALHAATRQYVLSQVAAAGTAAEWQESVLDKLIIAPGSPSTGARYLVGVVVDTEDDWYGHDNKIAEWSGTAWEFTVCTTGTFVSVDDETDGIYYFGGSSWTKKQWERNTAGSGIAIDVNGVVSASDIANSNIASNAAIEESKLDLDYSTDSLNTAIGGKEPTISAASSDPTLKYWRGDKSWQTLDTAVVAEDSSNLYFTDGRAQSAAVVDSTAGSETAQAASVSAMKSYVATQIAGQNPDYVTLTNKSGGQLVAGDIVVLSLSVANAIIAAKADAESTCTCVAGVVAETIENDAAGKVQISGIAIVRNNSVNLELGKRAYVSASVAKAATSTAPSALSSVVYLIGKAVDTNKVLLEMQLVGIYEAE